MPKKEEITEIHLFCDGERYQDDVFVCVNGVNYQIQRGKTVEVPASVAAVLQASEKQDIYAKQLMQHAKQGFGGGA